MSRKEILISDVEIGQIGFYKIGMATYFAKKTTDSSIALWEIYNKDPYHSTADRNETVNPFTTHMEINAE